MTMIERPTAKELKWMRRTGSAMLLFVPVAIRESIIAKGLGARNRQGTFSLTEQGRRFLWKAS